MSVFTNNETDDTLLLSQLRESNTDAYRVLYKKYWERTYNHIYKRLKDQDLAEDMTQDVFMQLWTKREDTRIDNLPAYLFVAGRNTVFKHFSRQARFVPINDLVNLNIADGEADSRLLLEEFKNAYEALIDSLPVAQQAIFRMRYHEDLSPGEIAEALNLSPKTVRNQLGKAITKVRSAMGLFAAIAICFGR